MGKSMTLYAPPKGIIDLGLKNVSTPRSSTLPPAKISASTSAMVKTFLIRILFILAKCLFHKIDTLALQNRHPDKKARKTVNLNHRHRDV
jgi:hypothetical protein